jgi:hypothetical protein
VLAGELPEGHCQHSVLPGPSDSILMRAMGLRAMGLRAMGLREGHLHFPAKAALSQHGGARRGWLP